jgi:hypothetical protein
MPRYAPPEPHGVRPLGGTRHTTAVPERGARLQRTLLLLPLRPFGEVEAGGGFAPHSFLMARAAAWKQHERGSPIHAGPCDSTVRWSELCECSLANSYRTCCSNSDVRRSWS